MVRFTTSRASTRRDHVSHYLNESNLYSLGRVARSPPSVLGGICLIGARGLAGAGSKAPCLSRAGRPFHPIPTPRQRLITASSSSGIGRSRFWCVAKGLPLTPHGVARPYLGEELPREFPETRPATRPTGLS